MFESDWHTMTTRSDWNGAWNFSERTRRCYFSFNYRGSSKPPIMVKLGMVPGIRPMHACGYHPCGDWVRVSLLKFTLRCPGPILRALADTTAVGEDDDDPEWTIVDCAVLDPRWTSPSPTGLHNLD